MTRNKFNAVPTTVEGIRFASKREAKRYGELRILEHAGQIRNLKPHPKFPIVIDGKPVKIRSERYPNGRSCSYTADFAYHENGAVVAEDSKGRDTEASRLRRALVEAIYGVQVRLV